MYVWCVLCAGIMPIYRAARPGRAWCMYIVEGTRELFVALGKFSVKNAIAQWTKRDDNDNVGEEVEKKERLNLNSSGKWS